MGLAHVQQNKTTVVD